MIKDAASALMADMEIPKTALNSSKDGARARAAGHAERSGISASASGSASASASASMLSLHTESLYLKYTSRDGDVLEIASERSEETYSAAGVSVYAGARKPSGAAGADDGTVAAENAAAAQGAAALTPAAESPDSEVAAEAEATVDARLEKLARLRDWAAEVEGELRKQQQKILEEYLKQTGKYMDGGEGRFFVLYAPTTEELEGVESAEEAQVPEYWNAENTSDRIVHFATQMAAIAGDDPEFAETIIKAVTDGFDQANAATGPLPGAAGKLNEKTRELTFSKLSKWLEEHKAKSYNQGTLPDAISTAEVSHGIENNEQ